MTTTELIELLKKYERGGATGRPREVMFEVGNRIIDTDGIGVTGSGDGLSSELYLSLPSAQPTLCGYNIEHLELIARVLQKENLPPERIAEALTDIGRIVAMVKDEFEQALRKQAIERLIRLTGCETNEEITARMDASVTDSEGWLGGVAACIDELEDMQGEWEAK